MVRLWTKSRETGAGLLSKPCRTGLLLLLLLAKHWHTTKACITKAGAGLQIARCCACVVAKASQAEWWRLVVQGWLLGGACGTTKSRIAGSKGHLRQQAMSGHGGRKRESCCAREWACSSCTGRRARSC